MSAPPGRCFFHLPAALRALWYGIFPSKQAVMNHLKVTGCPKTLPALHLTHPESWFTVHKRFVPLMWIFKDFSFQCLHKERVNSLTFNYRDCIQMYNKVLEPCWIVWIRQSTEDGHGWAMARPEVLWDIEDLRFYLSFMRSDDGEGARSVRSIVAHGSVLKFSTIHES